MGRDVREPPVASQGVRKRLGIELRELVSEIVADRVHQLPTQQVKDAEGSYEVGEVLWLRHMEPLLSLMAS